MFGNVSYTMNEYHKSASFVDRFIGIQLDFNLLILR